MSTLSTFSFLIGNGFTILMQGNCGKILDAPRESLALSCQWHQRLYQSAASYGKFICFLLLRSVLPFRSMNTSSGHVPAMVATIDWPAAYLQQWPVELGGTGSSQQIQPVFQAGHALVAGLSKSNTLRPSGCSLIGFEGMLKLLLGGFVQFLGLVQPGQLPPVMHHF